MSEQKQSGKKQQRFLRVLRRVLLGLGLLLALVAALLLSLPLLLSSNWARTQAAQQLTTATKLPSSLDGLSFSWSEGLRVSGLRIGSGELADPSFLASLDTLHLNFSLLPALRGDLRAEVELSGLRLHLPPPAAAAEAPPARPLPELLREAFATLRTALDTKPVQLDAHVRVDLNDITLRLEPAPGGKALELHKFFLLLELQGLKTSPLTLTSGLELKSDGAVLAPLRLEAKAEGFADAEGRVLPARARVTARLSAPGLVFTADGSLADSLALALRAALREATGPVQRLSPGTLPELDGTLGLTLVVAHAGPEHLSLGLGLDLDGLRAARGPLGDKAVGPFSLTLRQDVDLDLKAETMRLPGSLELARTSRARWQGELLGVREGAPRLALTVAPVHIALGELLPTVQAFLPPGLGLGSAFLDIQGLDVAAQLPRQPHQKPSLKAQLKGLKLEAKNVSQKSVEGNASVQSLALDLDSARVELAGSDPGLVEASLSLRADGLRKDGKAPLAARSFGLPRVTLRVDGFRQMPEALFGVSGHAMLELLAQASGMEAKGKAALPELTADLRLGADLSAAQNAALNLEALNLRVPLLRVLQQGKKPVEAPVTLRASAPDIRLTGPAPLVPTVHGLRLNLDLGEALRCAATVDLSGPGGRDLNTGGTLTLDAQKLLALAAPFAPRQARATGGLSLDWRLNASLPAPQPVAAPRNGGKAPAPAARKLSQTLRELNFLHEVEAVLRLGNLGLDWPLAAKPGQAAETLHLRGLSTPRPLRLTTSNGVEESSLAGSLAFGPMDALPGLGQLAKPLRGLVTLTAAQQGARSVQVSEILHLEGLDLDQTLNMTLDKLDTVLDRDQDRLAAVLELVDASLAFRLTTGLQALPPQSGGKGFSGSGRLETGAEVRLAGGRSLSLAGRLLSPGLDLRLGPDLAVTGLTSSLRINRRFSLAPGLRCPGAQESALAPLSEQVFDLFPLPAPAHAGPEALGQLLRADTSGPTGGSFGLAQLSLKSGGIPLDIRDVQVRLDADGPVPGLRSFRAGLLGGNILGSAMVRKAGARYTLDTDLAFTGLDPSRLLPGKASRDLGSQAETSGRLSLSVPLTPDPEALLQRLTLRLDITRIGPRTLERLLYALDPDEQNETIVQQRHMAGMGHPRWLRVAASYGNLGLSGAVEVKGFQLDLPQVDRLAIANLPLRKQLAKPLAAVPALLKTLDAISGTLICRDPADALGQQGSLRVVQPSTSQGVRP